MIVTMNVFIANSVGEKKEKLNWGSLSFVGSFPGSFPGGFNTWQHPALSASLYPLPEAAAYQEPGGLSSNTPLPVFAPAGLKGTQA